MNIEQQVIARARTLIIYQARYIWPVDYANNQQSEDMCVVADTMTDLQTYGMLAGTNILSEKKLIALAEKIGLKDLYHDDHWVDDVADYIVENKNDCLDLWGYLRSKI